MVVISQSDLATSNHNVGIHIDDDLSRYNARIRFGLALNNQRDIYTLNDTAGFGASAYDTGSYAEPLTYDSPGSVGAGFVSNKGNYPSSGALVHAQEKAY